MAKTLADKAYDILEDKILRSLYQPGELISEKKLSDELGIGRMPIREAIKRLENAYLVKVMPHRGIMVTEIRIDEIFLQIEVRRLLERLIAKRAAKYSTQKEKDHFLELADRYEKITQNGKAEEAMEVDDEFNEFVAKCCRNPFAAASLKPFHAHARRLYYQQYYDDPDTIKIINECHCKVMRAIGNGDAEKAVTASDELIDMIIKLYKDNYMMSIE